MRPIRLHPLIIASAAVTVLALSVGGILHLAPSREETPFIRPGMTSLEIEEFMGAPMEVLHRSESPHVTMWHGDRAYYGTPIENESFVYIYNWGIDQSCYVFFDREERAFLINSGRT